MHATAFAVLATLTTGAVLIATTLATTRGQAILIPYAIALVAVVLHLKRRNASFAQSFVSTLATLFFATVLLHAYIQTSVQAASTLSLGGHVWRLAVVAALASIVSAAVSFIASRGAVSPRSA